ncbi:hypothetical protein BJ742DRAFT_896087 [Cladochytrium replicatum]|nr:hypothetical protein BJ742DRAFT_896087 [Cladochytrium replicatum]
MTLHQTSGVIQMMHGAQNAGVWFSPSCQLQKQGTAFGGADERSDPAGYMDIEDRGCHVTWAGIARGKRRDRDGPAVSGCLQQQEVKMAAMALETSMRCAGELEKLQAQITEQEATAQGLRIELATLRGYANEEFAAIPSEIEVALYEVNSRQIETEDHLKLVAESESRRPAA